MPLFQRSILKSIKTFCYNSEAQESMNLKN